MEIYFEKEWYRRAEWKKENDAIVQTVYIGLQVNFNDMAERGTKKT